MKSWHVVALTAGGVVVLWLLVLSPWGLLRDRSQPAGPEEPAPAPTTRAGGAWPIFRGSQSLTGRASGRLADRLRLLWRFQTGDEVKSSPVVLGGRVFVGSSDGFVYALDLARGTKLWAFETEDAVEAPPLVLDGKVYAGSVDGKLYVLDAATGKHHATHRTEAQIIGSANWFRGPDGALRILVGSHDFKLYCLDAPARKLLWTYESENFVNGTPAVESGRVIFGGCDAMLHVVGADGEKVRTIDVGSYVPGSAALADGRAFVGNHEGKLLCADVETGRIVWTYGEGEQPFVSSPAVGPERVLAGSGDGLHCIDRKTGKRVWVFATRDAVDSSPVICGRKVVFGCSDGKLYVVALADGKEVWSYEVGEAITGSPAVAGGRILVGGLDGWVYAFGP